MVGSITDYVKSIIILIVALTFVELLLPNNKNKKYIMFSCSLIVVISVINPILGIFNHDIDVLSTIDEIKKEMADAQYGSLANYSVEDNIYLEYIENLKDNMKSKLQNIGYEVIESKVNIDETSFEPKNIEMRIKYKDGNIQPVVIDVFENSASEKVYDADIIKVKEILHENYGVDKKNININGK